MWKTLEKLLKKVPDSYPDFVSSLMTFLEDDGEEITKKIIKFMQENPDAKTDDIGAYHIELLGLTGKEMEIVDDDELDEEEK